jgi:hypothetical protein
MPNQVLLELGNLSNVVLAVACVAALWLLGRELGLNVSRSGFNASPTYGVGSYTALTAGGIVEVGFAPAAQPELRVGVQNGFTGNRAGMGGQEAPVFWNPGSFIDVNKLQSSGIQGEGADMNVPVDDNQAGFLGQRYPAPYVDGFANNLKNTLTSPY